MGSRQARPADKPAGPAAGTPLRTVTDAERRARIGTQHAIAPGARVDDVESAVAAMTCLHATEPANVYLSAFARAEVTTADLDTALYDARTVVRQLAMRRTVFAFPRDLLPAVRGSASARVVAMIRPRLAKDVAEGGIAADGTAWLDEACAAVLAEVRRGPATTQQLRERVPGLDARLEVEQRYGGGSIPVAPRVLSVLAADGSVLRGANAAGWKVSRPYWTAVEDWLPDLPGPTDATAGYAELVRRWLLTFGPGTEDDVVWWLGGTKGAVRRALADVGAVQVALEDGSVGYLHADDTAEVRAPGPWAALLPALDPTTMGWKGRGFYLGEHAASIFDRNGNGGPTAWWDGRIVGGWTQDDAGVVQVVPLPDAPSEALAPLAVEAERLTAYLDGDVVRTIYQSPLVRAIAR